MTNFNFTDDGTSLTAYLKVTGVLKLNITYSGGVQNQVYMDYRLSNTGDYCPGVSGTTPFIGSFQMGDGKTQHFVRIKIAKKVGVPAPTVAQYDGDSVTVNNSAL